MNPYQLLFYFLFLFLIMLWLFPKTMRAIASLMYRRTINSIYGKNLEKYSGIPIDKLRGLEVGQMTFCEVTDPFHDISPEDKAKLEELADKIVNDFIYDLVPDKEKYK